MERKRIQQRAMVVYPSGDEARPPQDSAKEERRSELDSEARKRGELDPEARRRKIAALKARVAWILPVQSCRQCVTIPLPSRPKPTWRQRGCGGGWRRRNDRGNLTLPRGRRQRRKLLVLQTLLLLMRMDQR